MIIARHANARLALRNNTKEAAESRRDQHICFGT